MWKFVQLGVSLVSLSFIWSRSVAASRQPPRGEQWQIETSPTGPTITEAVPCTTQLASNLVASGTRSSSRVETTVRRYNIYPSTET